MSKLKNVEHNLLARLANPTALISFSDDSHYSLEYLFRLAKRCRTECVEFDVLSGSSNLPVSNDFREIFKDLLGQIEVQFNKLGIKKEVESCRIKVKFDLNSETPVWVNKRYQSCLGICRIKLAC